LLNDDIDMSSPDHTDLLIRAYKAAWDHYFQPGRNGGVLECLARPALAKFLVEKTRQGIHDEPSLAAAGLQYLFSLEDPPEEPFDVSFDYHDPPEEPVDEKDLCWSMHLVNVSARFVPVGRVRCVA
jgi:hypothetical protein